MEFDQSLVPLCTALVRHLNKDRYIYNEMADRRSRLRAYGRLLDGTSCQPGWIRVAEARLMFESQANNKDMAHCVNTSQSTCLSSGRYYTIW